MLIHYYREANGDYLAVDAHTKAYRTRIGQPGIRDARVAAIDGNRLSVCTGAVSVDYLKTCTRVRPEDVPADWRARF